MREVPYIDTHNQGSSKQKTTKILFFSFIGHFLELYDYTLYVVMLSIISPLFFPSNSSASSLDIGMLSFGLSLLVSPFASWFWGWWGDKYGRLPMLKNSIMLMALPSMIITVLPTYEMIGILAPIILTLCRFMQTFSASGEVNGAKIFAMEHLGTKKLGRISGLLSCGGGLGVLLAMAMGLIISQTNLSWRIPFLLGSSLAIIGVLLRKKVAESPEFQKLTTCQKLNLETQKSTLTMLRENKNEAIIVTTLAATLGILSYTMHAFLNPYIISLGYSNATAYQLGIIGLIACGISSLLFGFLLDMKFHSSKIILYNIISTIILIPISFKLILNANLISIHLLYIAVILQGILLGMNATASSVITYQLFSPENRCRGVMINYSIGMAIFGGFTPYVLRISTQYSNFAPAVIISCLFLFSLIIYLKSIRNIVCYV
jgi:MFS family permease